MRKHLLLAVSAITTITGFAYAQDVVVMRRHLAPPRIVEDVAPVPKGPAELIVNGAIASTTNWQSSGTLSTFDGALKIARGNTAYQTTATQAEIGFTYTVKFAYSAYNFYSNPAQFTWNVTDTAGVVLASGSLNATTGNLTTAKTWGSFKGTGKAVKILITNASSGFCCPDALLIDNVSISR